jgi:alternate signal-mediated exported protein
MNKLLKGSIAGAVGVALLLGGAGTFASWNSSAAPTGGTIVAGTLLVSDPDSASAGTWTKGGSPITIATFRAVPGDVIVYSKTLNITATGDSLTAKLSLVNGAVKATSISTAPTYPADSALATALSESAALTVTGTGIVAGTGSNAGTFTVTSAAAGTQTVTVTATLTFANGAAGAENAAKLGSVNLSGFAVNLVQQ